MAIVAPSARFPSTGRPSAENLPKLGTFCQCSSTTDSKLRTSSGVRSVSPPNSEGIDVDRQARIVLRLADGTWISEAFDIEQYRHPDSVTTPNQGVLGVRPGPFDSAAIELETPRRKTEMTHVRRPALCLAGWLLAGSLSALPLAPVALAHPGHDHGSGSGSSSSDGGDSGLKGGGSASPSGGSSNSAGSNKMPGSKAPCPGGVARPTGSSICPAG